MAVQFVLPEAHVETDKYTAPPSLEAVLVVKWEPLSVAVLVSAAYTAPPSTAVLLVKVSPVGEMGLALAQMAPPFPVAALDVQVVIRETHVEAVTYIAPPSLEAELDVKAALMAVPWASPVPPAYTAPPSTAVLFVNVLLFTTKEKVDVSAIAPPFPALASFPEKVAPRVSVSVPPAQYMAPPSPTVAELDEKDTPDSSMRVLPKPIEIAPPLAAAELEVHVELPEVHVDAVTYTAPPSLEA